MFWRRKTLIGGNMMIFMTSYECQLVYWSELLWQFLSGLFLHIKEMVIWTQHFFFLSDAGLMKNWLHVILDKFLERCFIYVLNARVMWTQKILFLSSQTLFACLELWVHSFFAAAVRGRAGIYWAGEDLGREFCIFNCEKHNCIWTLA